MLANFASYFWGWLSNLFNGLASFFGNALGSLGSAISGMFTWLGGILKGLFQGILNGIGKILNALFAPILAFFNAIFFFVEELAKVLIDILSIMFQVIHVLLSIIWGIFRTLTGLTYNNSAPLLPSDVSGPFSHMGQALALLQLDNLAYVLRFGVWFFIAFACVKVVGNWGVGE